MLRETEATVEVELAGSNSERGKAADRGKRRGRLSLVQGNISCTLRGRRRMSTQLDQIAKKAKSNPKLRFTSLAHLLTREFLTETWKR
jgi:hypothetical protein